MPPEIANVFDNALSKSTAFNLTLQSVQATHAYDFNKLYSTIFKECDRYGWCQYIPTDNVAIFDGNITTGFYYIETNNYYPCHGDGWYCDMFICDILHYNIIVLDDIKYQIKPFNKLDKTLF